MRSLLIDFGWPAIQFCISNWTLISTKLGKIIFGQGKLGQNNLWVGGLDMT